MVFYGLTIYNHFRGFIQNHLSVKEADCRFAKELADGICAVTTLSGTENGERMPRQNHPEMLLQRIGYSDMMLRSYVDEKEFLAHELKFKIRLE